MSALHVLLSLTLAAAHAAAPVPGSAAPAAASAVPSRAELGRRALETVVSQLKNDDSDVRARAAEVLGYAGNPAAVPMLKTMLSDRDKYVRIAASRSLWELGNPSGLRTVFAIINDAPAQGPVANSPLVELKVISQNKIREKAIEALAWMKGEKSSELLYKLKNDVSGTIRDAAARELARLGRAEELAQFTDALASEDEAVRYEGASVLGRICPAEAAGALKDALSAETTVRVKMALLDALACNPAAKEAEEQLLKLSEDANPTIKYKAVAALSGLRSQKARARLMAVADDQASDLRLKMTAQKGLMRSGAAPDVKTAGAALLSVRQEVQLEALDVISFFPDDEAAPLLQQGLADANVHVKLSSALQVLRRFSKK